MNLTKMVMLLAIPMASAYLAVVLALACKYHPRTNSVILTGEDAADVKTVPQSSDMDSRAKMTLAAMIAILVVLAASLILAVVTHADSVPDFLESFLEGLDVDVLIVMFYVALLATNLPVLIRSQVWATPLREVLAGLMSAAIVLAWVLFDNWVAFDLLVILVTATLTVVIQPRMSFLKLSLILTIVAIFYDLIQVNGTGNMIESASTFKPVFGVAGWHVNIPMLLAIPGSLSLYPQKYGYLGAGDMAIFSLMAISTALYARRIGSRIPVAIVFLGFAAGISACNVVNILTHTGQAATIYFVPLCALLVMLFAWRHGSFKLLGVSPYGPAIRKKETKGSK